ncbi:MAG TPA: hypothetical protein PKA64_03320 [Myxococcota bacterium]|nr:hypothetical protein [Myxococcota bacterium]
MRCPEAHGGDEGELYFAIMTEEQGERFHAATDLAWMTRYGEPMPAARRPGRKPAPAAVVILRFSAEEIADVDARRGALSRADFLKRRATG